MHDSPLITCVIPTYRRPRMLARAIQSVLNQTFSRLRVLVTDNASGDGTSEVVGRIQAKDLRVIYHCQPRNIGMNANFAYGMSRVDTPFFSLLSDDDVLLPEFYETAYSEFQKFPQAILVATQVPCVTEEGRLDSEPLSLWDRTGLFNPPEGAYRVASIAHPTITGILFRRDLLQTPYVDPYIHAGDYHMILGAALHYPIVTIGRAGALFVAHRGTHAAPCDPFSVIDYHLAMIRRVDEDDRFPRVVKLANRQRWCSYLSSYLRSLVVCLGIRGDRLGVERALIYLVRDLEYSGMSARLQLVAKLCLLIPSPLRPRLATLYASLSRWKNCWRQSQLPMAEAKYRESLGLE